MKETFAVMEETFAVMEETFAVMEETFAVMEEIFAVMEEAFAVMEEAFAVMEETFAVMEETFAVTEETFAVMEETFPSGANDSVGIPILQIVNPPFSNSGGAFAALQSKPDDSNNDSARAGPELTRFSELADHGIIDSRVIDNISRMKIHTMTDVQRMTINECLDGSDVIGQAKTGTGKTLAFLMPVVQRMMLDADVTSRWERPTPEDIRALIISPTRELAEQIAVEAEKITAGTRLVVQTAVGGTQKSFHLRKMQRQGCHLLVGTPGRVTDLLADPQSGVKLDRISAFVLDEADRLLDIGFAPAIEEIQSYMPAKEVRDRQTLMFSATVPRSVVSLVRQTLKPDFKFIRTIDPDEAPVHERIPQKKVFLPGLQNQIPAVVELATRAIEAHRQDPEKNAPFKAVVFANSQSEVALLKSVLQNMRDPSQGNKKRGLFEPHPLSPCQIHELYGKLSQRERNANTDGFRKAKSAILCSSDVAARGMDFPNVSHVIQLGLPKGRDDYIHRIGRTGRAGKSGEGWLFMNEGDERTWDREFGRDLKLAPDDSLYTTSLDMTKGQQLPANIARVMQLVESGIRATPYELKAEAYRSLLSALKQSPAKYRDQDIIDMVNMLTRYGWGLEKPPTVSSRLVERMGLSRCQGLEVSDSAPDHGRGGDRRGGGFRSGRQDSYDRRDPFAMGMGGGAGTGRSFGGDRGLPSLSSSAYHSLPDDATLADGSRAHSPPSKARQLVRRFFSSPHPLRNLGLPNPHIKIAGRTAVPAATGNDLKTT
ncbi:hypothetical protein DV737_g4801, partial [Chaetothyriales sp. CBS 132003]